MIRQIRGDVTYTTDTTVVIDVAGVGYLVHTSVPSTQFMLDQEVLLHTYMAVRETALDLYGFLTRDELEMFEILLSLQKIGPKSAMGIMGNADIALLKETVRNDDPVHLSKMSGIGKKTAEKIVAGLKDKIENIGFSTDEPGSDNTSTQTTQKYSSDTIDALIALGYPQHDARKVTQQILAEHPEITDSAEALKIALKLLSN